MPKKSSATTEKYVLLTNISYATIGNVRTHCRAILLSASPSMMSKDKSIRCTMRGFGVDPAWEVFDMDVPSIDFSSEERQSSALIVSDHNNEMRPLFQANRIQLTGGPLVTLIRDDDRSPLDVATFVGNEDEREESAILRVWEILPLKVAQYWYAPNMPRLAWGMSPYGLRRAQRG